MQMYVRKERTNVHGDIVLLYKPGLVWTPVMVRLTGLVQISSPPVSL